MDTERFIELIEDAGYRVRSYSGRGMYGRQCVGVELDSTAALVSFGRNVALGATQEEQAQLAQMSESVDSLGLGLILYYPYVNWPKDRPEDEEDDSG